MCTMAFQITSLSTVYSDVCSGAHQRKQQSSVILAFMRGIHRWPVGSPHKGPVTRKMLMTSSWTTRILWFDSWFSYVCHTSTPTRKRIAVPQNMILAWPFSPKCVKGHLTQILFYHNVILKCVPSISVFKMFLKMLPFDHCCCSEYSIYVCGWFIQ